MNVWYVLYLRPRCEKRVADYCRANGVSHFLPLRRETKIYQRRKVTVDKPLFAGYFFAGFDADERQELLQTDYVLRILTPLRQRPFLHQLAQIRKALRVDPTLGAESAIQRGQTVRITGGPFMGIEGVVTIIKGNATVSLNIEMIGQSVTVVVDRAYLEPVGAG